MPERIQLRRTKGGRSKATTYSVRACRRCPLPGAKGQQGFCGPECRFWSKVERPSPSGCWTWTGARLSATSDYGRIDVAGVRYVAHRYAYVLLVGPIPDGHELDHLCENQRCVNPAHVEPVTPDEHGRRSVRQRERAKHA